MKTVIRVLIGVVVLAIVAVAALSAYFAFVFDPNDYRDRLAETVEQQTGRKLTLSGDIELSVFPWLGLKLGAAELGNAPGFSERPFASLSAAEARVKLAPLLGGEVAIDRVTLHGLQLSLERNKAGETNWADLIGEDTPHGAGEAADERAGEGAPVSLAVGGIDVQNASIRWSDAQNGREDVISDVAVVTGEILPGAPFDLDAGVSFALAQPAANGRATLVGRVTLDLAAQRYRIEDLRATVKADGAGLPGGSIDAGLMAGVDADLQAGTVSVDRLALTAYQVQMIGALKATSVTDTPAVDGTLEIAGLDPRVLMEALGLRAPATANPEQLKRASFKARVSGTPSRVALDDIVATLDDSKINGSLALADLEKSAVRFDLTIDKIDVDSYLPPAGESAAPDAASAKDSKNGETTAASPLDLRGLDVAGQLKIGALKVHGMDASAIDVGVKLAGGRLEVMPKASLYGGRLDATTVLEARGAPTGLSVNGSLTDVQLGEVLRAVSGKPEKLTGRARVSAKLRGTGLDADSLKKTLAGTVDLKVLDGALKGINIARFFREAEARLSGTPVEAVSGAEQTDFSDLAASLQLGGGVVRNDDLSMRSPLLRVGGEGSANLLSESIDYLVKATLVGTLTGQGGKSLDQVRDITVPVRVSGTFSDPKYTLDAEALLSGAVKGRLDAEKAKVEEKVKAKVDEAREDAKGKIQEELKKGLGGLFK